MVEVNSHDSFFNLYANSNSFFLGLSVLLLFVVTVTVEFDNNDHRHSKLYAFVTLQ
ncbi:putative G-type lectin S-receptor-like serine/threonine-protein, partial [Sesbania bispinosa]